MKAAVLHKIGGPFVIEEVELLPPQPNEVRVRLAAAGTCHSDWHFVVGNIQRSGPWCSAMRAPAWSRRWAAG